MALTQAELLKSESIDDRVNSLLVAGTGINLTYDDNANTLTIAGQPVSLINENKIVIDSSVTIGDGYNGLSVGPVEVAATYSVEVPAGSTWVIL